MVLRQPVGVVAAITPWNFPGRMITCGDGPRSARVAPSSSSPRSRHSFPALARPEVPQRAGIPDGVINVVTGNAAATSREFTGNDKVRKL
jgi:succinate-semialdehyde dehydrogenase/glutarate-semialdehyde dehydrogenase